MQAIHLMGIHREGPHCMDAKGKSLTKRCISCSTTAANNYGINDINFICNNGFWIEIGVVITSFEKVGSGRNVPVNSRTYHVLGFYDNHYKKWFRTVKNNPWGSLMNSQDKISTN